MISKEKALARLQDMCVRAEHCEGEMRQKLRGWEVSKADADEIIAKLKQEKFVDDERFTNAYVRDKVKFAHWGRRKIAQNLAVKRIDKAIAQQALADVDMEDYEAMLTAILQAKVKANESLLTTYEGRTKLYRFALTRGFETDLVSKAIKALYQDSQAMANRSADL